MEVPLRRRYVKYSSTDRISDEEEHLNLISPVRQRREVNSVTPNMLYSNSRPKHNGGTLIYRSELVANIHPVSSGRKPRVGDNLSPKSKHSKPRSSSSRRRRRGYTMPNFSDSIRPKHFDQAAPSSTSSSSQSPNRDLYFDHERSLPRTYKHWRADSQWSPATGRLFEPLGVEQLTRTAWSPNFTEAESRRTGRYTISDFPPTVFGSTKRWTSNNRERNRSFEQTSPWDSIELRKPGTPKNHTSRSPRIRRRAAKGRSETVAGIELSTSLCENCGVGRSHFQDVCLYCRRTRVNSHSLLYPSHKPNSKITSNTEFLRAAAAGLGEFANSSDDEQISRPMEPSNARKLNGYTLNNLNRSISPDYDNLSPKIRPSGQNYIKKQASVSAEPSSVPKMLSSSGSSMNGSDRQSNSSVNRQRPRLPPGLKEAQYNSTGYDSVKMDGDTTGIVHQLELRSQEPTFVYNGKPSNVGLHLEDQEVEHVLSNGTANTGVNGRLLALNRQRFKQGSKEQARNITLPANQSTPLAKEQSNHTIGECSAVRAKTPGARNAREHPSALCRRNTLTQIEFDTRNATQSPESTCSSSTKSGTSSKVHTTRTVFTPGVDRQKSSARFGLQRRLAYNPKATITAGLAKDTAPVRQKNSSATPIHTTYRTLKRRSAGITRTAPVDTSDCLAAIEIVKAGGPSYQTPNRTITIKDEQKPGFQRARPIEVDNKQRNPSVISGRNTPCSDKAVKRAISVSAKKEEIDRRSSAFARTVRRAESQKGNRAENEELIPTKGLKKAEEQPDLLNACQEAVKSESDVALESLRYKTERVAEMIVKLRKRIERDFAQAGCCSPGDDILGDQAVGAVVDGKSTGMQPNIASCMKSLRTLEFNALEIFSLLYPNELDTWGPERDYLAGVITNEFEYNEAKGKLIEDISKSLQASSLTTDPTTPTSGKSVPSEVSSMEENQKQQQQQP